MIQIQIGTTGVIVLEPGNIECFKAGRFMPVEMKYFGGPPLEILIIDYSPDLPFCEEKMAQLIAAKGPQNISPHELQAIIRESQQRPEVKDRPMHGCIDLIEFATAKGPTN